MKDQQLLLLLRSNAKDRALNQLYRYWPKVEKLIRAKGGNKQDAQDIFQEALILFCQKAVKADFQLTASIDTYLYSTCRLMWRNELRKRGKQNNTTLEFSPQAEELDLEAALEQEGRFKQMEQILDELGKRCWQILRYFYFDALRMKEIARKMNFSSEKIAKNQKYKCLERAREKLRATRA